MDVHPLRDRSLRPALAIHRGVRPVARGASVRPTPSVGRDRLAQIRQRVCDGLYASPEAAEALAGYLLATGVIGVG